MKDSDLFYKILGLSQGSIDYINDTDTTSKTLDDLCIAFELYRDVIPEYAKWRAVLGWIGARHEATLDPSGARTLFQTVSYYVEYVQALTGIPTIYGNRINPQYKLFYRSKQSRIKKKALTLRAEWEAEGEPGLDQAIRVCHNHMKTALANRLHQ